MSSSQPDWGFLPLSLNIVGRLCLVLGEGEEAGRKTALLQKAGARVSVLADLDELLSLLPQAALVVTCSRDAGINQRVSEQCRLVNTPVNVFENPGLSSFIFPSIIDRYPMLIAEEPFRGGEVYLVGAGPGDPELLSFRALRLMRQADVVLYDRLVSAPILELVRRDAERIYVGKARAEHAVPQEEINLLLVRLALQNKRVLRLKGGDPFIFGRGGEEIDKLAENGIPFQVVPGITAASGCAAYAGIPLTHRDFSQSVRFVTGHLKNNSTDLCWPDLIQKQQTLVFYMGLVGLPEITRQLQAHGMPATMPVAVISKGTLPDQKVVTGTLADIAERVVVAHLPGPTIIIVGEVVSLRDKLNWLECRYT